MTWEDRIGRLYNELEEIETDDALGIITNAQIDRRRAIRSELDDLEGGFCPDCYELLSGCICGLQDGDDYDLRI